MRRIALLMPVFQNQLGAEKSLASLDGETPLDILLVDDGSNPPLRVPEVKAPHSVTLLRQRENGGITRALNAGLDFIFQRGYDYVARLDAGDLAIPRRFEMQAKFLDSNPDVAVVGSAVRYVSAEGETLFIHRLPEHHDSITRHMRRNTAFCHPSVMMRVSDIRTIGYYSDRYPAAEDYDYFYRIVDRYRTANLPDVFLVKEVSRGSISIKRRRRQLLSRLRVQVEHFRVRSLQSHLGVASTLAFLAIPNELLMSAKRKLWS